MDIKADDFKLIIQEEFNSPLNGRLLVINNPLLGLNVITDDKTVISGQAMDIIWEKGILQVNKLLVASNFRPIRNCLILGLGVGNNIKQIRKYWPNTKVIGVEVDPVMLTIGKKYFDLNPKEKRVEIVLADTAGFVPKTNFDLILVDLFIGNTVPQQFESKGFLEKIKHILNPNGVVIFNRITSRDQKRPTLEFKNALTKRFSRINEVYFHNNSLFLCQK